MRKEIEIIKNLIIRGINLFQRWFGIICIEEEKVSQRNFIYFGSV